MQHSQTLFNDTTMATLHKAIFYVCERENWWTILDSRTRDLRETNSPPEFVWILFIEHWNWTRTMVRKFLKIGKVWDLVLRETNQVKWLKSSTIGRKYYSSLQNAIREHHKSRNKRLNMDTLALVLVGKGTLWDLEAWQCSQNIFVVGE